MHTHIHDNMICFESYTLFAGFWSGSEIHTGLPPCWPHDLGGISSGGHRRIHQKWGGFIIETRIPSGFQTCDTGVGSEPNSVCSWWRKIPGSQFHSVQLNKTLFGSGFISIQGLDWCDSTDIRKLYNFRMCFLLYDYWTSYIHTRKNWCFISSI